MKAEGSADNPDAQHVRENCMHPKSVGLVELITPEVRMDEVFVLGAVSL